MSKKLFKFKEWLTIPEAANHLSAILDDEIVTVADILELGLNGDLKLSVHFPAPVYAWLGVRKSRQDVTKLPRLRFLERKNDPISQPSLVDDKEITDWVYMGMQIGEDEFFEFDGGLKRINDTWDLPLYAGERTFVENLYYSEKAGIDADLVNLYGAYVHSYQKGEMLSMYQLAEYLEPSGASFGSCAWSDENNYVSMDSLPSESILVVRTESLRDFELNLKGSQAESNEKILSAKTENSYLRLIQSLAEYATDGLTGKPATDANTIRAALESKKINCPVGEKALAGYLEKAQKIPK